MKFDNIIIGGGLSGLVCGITLAKAGRRVAIIAAGQSTLHFGSGSFDLLGYDGEGAVVEHPLDAIASLAETHPYKKVGIDRIASLASEATALLAECGLKTKGCMEQNHYRLTPLGTLKPTWLTLEDYLTTTQPDSLPYRKVLLVNIPGFLDFPTQFISDGLRRMGTMVEMEYVSIPSLKHRRNSPTEMRSANLAKILLREKKLQQIAHNVNKLENDVEAVIMPAIVGLQTQEALDFIRSKVKKPLHFIATLPPSVPGVRVQTLLRKHFSALGGIYLLGNTVKGGTIRDGHLIDIETSLLPDERMEAQEFILASGSFQSDGLKSNYERIYEPIFDLDVDADSDRAKWVSPSVFDAQPYMEYGVHTNEHLQVQKGGQTIDNLYAVGSVLSGHNAIKLADGTGVSILTALAAAKDILKK